MAEVIGIVAAAIAFAQTSAAVLDVLKKIKDTPKYVHDLQQELYDLESVLRQIDDTVPFQKGDSIEMVLRRCCETLKQLHELIDIAPENNHKLMQLVKVLRIRPKENDIESFLRRLQSQKLTLTLALIARVNKGFGNSLSFATLHTLPLHGQDSEQSTEAKSKSPDTNVLTRVIDHRLMVITQQLEHDPTSTIEDLLGLDQARTDELWRLDLDSVRRIKGAVDERQRERFLESLRTPDYQQDRLRIRDASESTCEWIWSHSEYTAFQTSPQSGITHVAGKAGSGKSVLAKHIWNRVSSEIGQSPDHDVSALLFHCCDKRTRPDETGSSILRSLIHQFLLQKPSLFRTAVAGNELMQSHSFTGQETDWTFGSLWSIFRASIIKSQLQVIYCIVDALDECEQESMEDFLSHISEFLQHDTNGVAVKFILTSRVEGYIMDSIDNPSIRIHIDSATTRDDVKTFVCERLGRLKRRLRLNKEMECSLQQILVDRAEGMFLWADLAIKDLERAHGLTAKTLHDRVRSLPSGLNALYERMLTKIEAACVDENDVRLVRKVLTWVSLAVRPLTLAELRVAIAIELDTKRLEAVDILQNVSYELLNLCGPLIEIIQNNTSKTFDSELPPPYSEVARDNHIEDLTATVRLIHQSAKEYLIDLSNEVPGPLSNFGINRKSTHVEIAQICLTYLLCDDFEDEPITFTAEDDDKTAMLEKKFDQYELFKYASLYWPTHARESTVDGELELSRQVCRFFSDFPERFRSWYQTYRFLSTSRVIDTSCTLSIHAACACGLYNVLRLLLDKEVEINARTASNSSALDLAVYGEYIEVVNLLLDRGADINSKGQEGRTVLHETAATGKLDIFKLLLNRGADIEARSTNNHSPLSFAAANGHSEIARLLLDQGAKINVRSDTNRTPLHDASQYGYLEVVKLLLNYGAEIEAKDNDSTTALHNASQNGHVEVVKLLLDHGAEIEVKGNDSSMAHHHASYNGHVEVVKLLLDRGASIEAEDVSNRTVLHNAAQYGHLSLVELLLNQGANIEAKEINGCTTLLLAANSGHIEVVSLLLDRKAEVMARAKNDFTALHHSSASGHLDITKVLLDQGVEVNAKSTKDWTPLHYASQYGYQEVVNLLLDRGADITAENTNNGTALHLAAINGHLDVVKLLLTLTIETRQSVPNNSTKALHTTLCRAAAHGHTEVVKLLLDWGACIELDGPKSMTSAICDAAGRGEVDVLKVLIDWAETEKLDVDISAGFYFATIYGQLEVTKLLLDRHPGLVEEHYYGQMTALHYAASEGQLGVVKLLLDRGAQIEAESSDKYTSLHLAAQNGHLDVVKVLLDQAVDLPKARYMDMLPVAAYEGNEALVQLLLENAEAITAQNDAYGEALQIACIRGHLLIVDHLIHAGASINKTDEHGWTPLLCASWCQQYMILERLLAVGGDLDSVVQAVPLRPTSWSASDKSARLLLGEDGVTLTYVGDSNKTIAAAARANHPVPLQSAGFYFEITILNGGETGIIGLGLCSALMSLDALPGWRPFSWGYHGDDGKFHGESGTGTAYGDTYGPGDVVGCYIKPDQGILFTKNGKSLGKAFEYIPGKLYPVVAMKSCGASIRVDFGVEEFNFCLN